MDKLLPYDQNAEEAVIGSLIIDGSIIQMVSKIIKPADFYLEQTASIYKGCLDLYNRREGVNQITIARELHRTGKLENTGGAAYLSHLISICPTSLDAEYYADIVRRLSVCRQAIALGQKISGMGYNGDPDTNALITNISGEVDRLRQGNTISKKLVTPTDAGNLILNLIDTYNQPGNAISSGFYDLDEATTGFYQGEMTIIGARPSVGKTQIMLDIAENMADKGHKVLFASVEMSMSQIMERKVSRSLGVSIRKMRRNGLDDDQMEKISDLAGYASLSPIHYLSDGAGLSDIVRELDTLAETQGVDVLFVDYLQRIKDCWEGGENMNIRTGRVSWSLKSMAKNYNIPIIVASQLSRASEIRENKRPTLADLRDSGNIEQDADNVVLLYRTDEEPQYLELKQVKNRQLGDYPVIRLAWNEQRRRYVNATR